VLVCSRSACATESAVPTTHSSRSIAASNVIKQVALSFVGRSPPAISFRTPGLFELLKGVSLIRGARAFPWWNDAALGGGSRGSFE
jgi:hypothetical protein